METFRQGVYKKRYGKLATGLAERQRLYGIENASKIGVSRLLYGHTIQHHLECPGDASAFAGGASAAGLAARQIFWWGAVSGPEAHHAHARPAHGLRERALPQHGRVLGAWHCDVHDSQAYLHARLPVLRH